MVRTEVFGGFKEERPKDSQKALVSGLPCSPEPLGELRPGGLFPQLLPASEQGEDRCQSGVQASGWVRRLGAAFTPSVS